LGKGTRRKLSVRVPEHFYPLNDHCPSVPDSDNKYLGSDAHTQDQESNFSVEYASLERW